MLNKSFFFAAQQTFVLTAGPHGKVVFFQTADAPDMIEIDIVAFQTGQGFFDGLNGFFCGVVIFGHALGGDIKLIPPGFHGGKSPAVNVFAAVLAVVGPGVKIGDAFVEGIAEQFGVGIVGAIEVKSHPAKADGTD